MEKVTDINVNTINSIPHVRIALSKLIKALEDYSPGDIDELEEQVENHEERIGEVEEDVENIQALIPNQASPSNKLADKEFVNSSIASNTGTYRGNYNLWTDLELEPTATHEAIAIHLKLKPVQGNNNDYCFVEIPTSTSTPTVISKVERYKWVGDSTGNWAYEYTIDNSSIPQLEERVEELEEKVEELDDTAVRTNSYDATVGVGLADNLRGDTVVNAEFYKRKTGGTQSVGSGIAAIKEVRGKSIVWNQLAKITKIVNGTKNGVTLTKNADGSITFSANSARTDTANFLYYTSASSAWKYPSHKYFVKRTNNARIIFRIYKNNSAGIQEVTTNSAFISNLSANDHISGFGFTVYGSFVGSVTFTPTLIDLTLMFGAGNEPATVEEFEKMFPLDYYDYNAGTIIPFAGQNLVTTGKNQYNFATGKANLLGGQTYQIGGTFTGATIDEVAVTLDSNNCFTTTKDCVLDVTGGNNTDTIVTLYNGENVTYESYVEHTLALNPSQWRDKQGNLVFPYGGMHGVGNVYDYAKVDADGYIRRVVRRFGAKDLGTVSWSIHYNNDTTVGFGTDITNWGTHIGYQIKKTCICSKYYYNIKVGHIGTDVYTDKMVYFRASKYIIINDSSYTDATTFKSAMQGVPLIYELETPVEVELATPIYAKYLVDKDGTEEITPANSSTPYTTKANLSIIYAMDARGEIKNLPKNYLSKESAENMLNAMVTAGVIANYTMTYDAANGMYAFVITAPTPEPVESNE